MTEEIKATFINLLENLVPMHRLLGVQVLEISDGFVKMRFPFREEHIGDMRVQRLHGGFLSAAADICGGAAAMTQMKSPHDDVSTADMRIDFLRPGKAKVILVEGQIVHKTSRTIFVDMKILHDDSEDLIAVGRGVFVIKHK